MYCVKNSQTIEDTLKKSRFIGIIIPCQTENDALQQLHQCYQQHPNASHIVFAYRIKSSKGIVSRFNDAGEPSGTAGKPVYQQLEGKDLINVLVVVIRYYGGIKLGAGGLIRAYGHTAKKAITASKITEYIDYIDLKLELDYKQMQHFEYQLNKLEGKIVKRDFSEKIHLVVKLPEKNQANLIALFR